MHVTGAVKGALTRREVRLWKSWKYLLNSPPKASRCWLGNQVLRSTKLTVFIIVFKVSCNSKGSFFLCKSLPVDHAVKRESIWCFLYNSCNKTWLRIQHGWSPVCAYVTEIAPVKIFRFKEFCKFLHYIFTFCRLFKRLTKQEFLLQHFFHPKQALPLFWHMAKLIPPQ